MNVESIEFNTQQAKLVVTFDDESKKEYLNKEDYLKDFPDRELDCINIGLVNNI